MEGTQFIELVKSRSIYAIIKKLKKIILKKKHIYFKQNNKDTYKRWKINLKGGWGSIIYKLGSLY